MPEPQEHIAEDIFLPPFAAFALAALALFFAMLRHLFLSNIFMYLYQFRLLK
ncbi:MAG: hypothetical protein HY515_05030 [Candidatus Aenigmarchaeota archaeon]|nr:hypothetical protein [Candidatus Aenigmarchaeota archaeon]